jgi:hypothetical protein
VREEARAARVFVAPALGFARWSGGSMDDAEDWRPRHRTRGVHPQREQEAMGRSFAKGQTVALRLVAT